MTKIGQNNPFFFTVFFEHFAGPIYLMSYSYFTLPWTCKKFGGGGGGGVIEVKDQSSSPVQASNSFQ